MGVRNAVAKRPTKKTNKKKPIESYDHKDKKRANNPPVGLVTPETDPDAALRAWQPQARDRKDQRRRGLDSLKIVEIFR